MTDFKVTYEGKYTNGIPVKFLVKAFGQELPDIVLRKLQDILKVDHDKFLFFRLDSLGDKLLLNDREEYFWDYKVEPRLLYVTDCFITNKVADGSDAAKVAAPKETNYEYNAIHPTVTCDNCLKFPLVGFRYKCLECSNFDLCESCEGIHKHAHHIMLRIPNSEATDKHQKNIYVNAQFGKEPTIKEQHGKERCAKEHHGKEHHGKEHHGKEHHGKEKHGKEKHGKEHHGKERHSKERRSRERQDETPKHQKNSKNYFPTFIEGLCNLGALGIPDHENHGEQQAPNDKPNPTFTFATNTNNTAVRPRFFFDILHEVAAHAAKDAARAAVNAATYATSVAETFAQNPNDQPNTQPSTTTNNASEEPSTSKAQNGAEKPSGSTGKPSDNKNKDDLANISSIILTTLGMFDHDKTSKTPGTSSKSVPVSTTKTADVSTTTAAIPTAEVATATIIKPTSEIGTCTNKASTSEASTATNILTTFEVGTGTSSENNVPNNDQDWDIVSNDSIENLSSNVSNTSSLVSTQETNTDAVATSTVGTNTLNATDASDSNEGNDRKKPAQTPTIYHPDAIINTSVIAMMAMGFSNENSFLVKLLESVHGNIEMALDKMQITLD